MHNGAAGAHLLFYFTYLKKRDSLLKRTIHHLLYTLKTSGNLEGENFLGGGGEGPRVKKGSGSGIQHKRNKGNNKEPWFSVGRNCAARVVFVTCLSERAHTHGLLHPETITFPSLSRLPLSRFPRSVSPPIPPPSSPSSTSASGTHRLGATRRNSQSCFVHGGKWACVGCGMRDVDVGVVYVWTR